MSSIEFAEWLAYYSLRPFGDDLIDSQFAQLQALTANIHRDPKKGRRYKVEDFLLSRQDEDEEPMTERSIFQRLKMNLGLSK